MSQSLEDVLKSAKEACQNSATTSYKTATRVQWVTSISCSRTYQSAAPPPPPKPTIYPSAITAAIKAAASHHENAFSVLDPYLNTPRPKGVPAHEAWRITCDMKPNVLSCTGQLPSDLLGDTAPVQEALVSLWEDQEYMRLYRSLPEQGVKVTFWHPEQTRRLQQDNNGDIGFAVCVGFVIFVLFVLFQMIIRQSEAEAKASEEGADESSDDTDMTLIDESDLEWQPILEEFVVDGT